MSVSSSLHRLGASSAILLLVGCASSGGLHPQGHAVDVSALHAQRSLAAAHIDRAAWPRAEWWKSFNDPQLDALMGEALAGNPDLDIADARARTTQAQAGLAEAARLPSLSASAGVAGARIPDTLIPQPFGGHFGIAKYGILDFKWDFDLWGGKRAAWQAALGAARAADIDAQAAHLLLSANVVRAYAVLGTAYTQRDLAQTDLQRAQHFAALTQQRVAAGIDNRMQQERADADVAAAHARATAADHQVRSAGIALTVLLGRGPDRAFDLARPKPLSVDAVALPSDLPADLLGRRPDVVAARWRVEAAAKDIKSAKAAFLPNLNITALAGLIAGPGANLFRAAAGLYSIAPAVSLPIFEGGRLRANLAGKDAAYDLAVAQYDKIVIGAINQVADVADALRALDAQRDDVQRAVAAAQRAYDLALKRYQGGIGNDLEVLAARAPLLAAEQQQAALDMQRANAAVQLVEALGGGFRPGADAAAVATTPNQATNKKSTP